MMRRRGERGAATSVRRSTVVGPKAQDEGEERQKLKEKEKKNRSKKKRKERKNESEILAG